MAALGVVVGVLASTAVTPSPALAWSEDRPTCYQDTAYGTDADGLIQVNCFVAMGASDGVDYGYERSWTVSFHDQVRATYRVRPNFFGCGATPGLVSIEITGRSASAYSHQVDRDVTLRDSLTFAGPSGNVTGALSLGAAGGESGRNWTSTGPSFDGPELQEKNGQTHEYQIRGTVTNTVSSEVSVIHTVQGHTDIPGRGPVSRQVSETAEMYFVCPF
jgi:hypothetical protein